MNRLLLDDEHFNIYKIVYYIVVVKYIYLTKLYVGNNKYVGTHKTYIPTTSDFFFFFLYLFIINFVVVFVIFLRINYATIYIKKN